MQTIHVNYSITVSDFRKATYYGLFLRHRRALQIMFLVLGVSILYAIGGALGLGTVNYLVFFLALAYLIWGIFLFAGAEKGIRQHIAQVCNLPARCCKRGKRRSQPAGQLRLSSLSLIFTCCRRYSSGRR